MRSVLIAITVLLAVSVEAEATGGRSRVVQRQVVREQVVVRKQVVRRPRVRRQRIKVVEEVRVEQFKAVPVYSFQAFAVPVYSQQIQQFNVQPGCKQQSVRVERFEVVPNNRKSCAAMLGY